MKTLPLLCAIVLVCAARAFAQEGGGRPRIDNFDLPQGVRVASVPTTGVLPSKKVRLTARSVASTWGASAQPKQLLYTRPRVVAGMTNGKSLEGFTTGDAKIDALIVESGSRNGVDPLLLYAIMHRESAFKLRATSNKGARGLMQLMPATAARFGVGNIYEPRQNIEGGARYMSFLLNFFGGDVSLALAGYNAGEGAVLKYGRRIPPYSETQEYVRRISQRYTLMRDPQTVARNALTLTSAQTGAAQAELDAPAYERNVSVIRLSNGQYMLLSQ